MDLELLAASYICSTKIGSRMSSSMYIEKKALPLHSPPSLLPISYYEQILQILFLLCMYSIAIATLSHKPSQAGCISCR